MSTTPAAAAGAAGTAPTATTTARTPRATRRPGAARLVLLVLAAVGAYHLGHDPIVAAKHALEDAYAPRVTMVTVDPGAAPPL